jgi:membrane protease YdiL (CAAX protease family)
MIDNTGHKRILIAAVFCLVFVSNFWPAKLLRNGIRNFADNPGYQGVWIMVEHIFLYTTLCALLTVFAWWGLSKRNILPHPKRSFGFGGSGSRVALFGIGSAAAIVLLNLTLILIGKALGGIDGAIEIGLKFPHGDDWWEHAGNLFSNLYEEIIYRGLIIVAIISLLKKKTSSNAVWENLLWWHAWLGIVISGIVFGLVHTQYPLPHQLVLAIQGGASAWIFLKTKSIWTCWIQHVLIDVLMATLVMNPSI